MKSPIKPSYLSFFPFFAKAENGKNDRPVEGNLCYLSFFPKSAKADFGKNDRPVLQKSFKITRFLTAGFLYRCLNLECNKMGKKEGIVFL